MLSAGWIRASSRAAAWLIPAIVAIAPARATLYVLAVEPQPNATGSTWVPQVEARFNQPIAPPWVTLRSFSTRGQRSGPVTGEFSFSPDLRTVRFHPFAPTLDHFDAGEQVEVTLGTALRAMTGEVLQEPVSWHFRTLARSGAGSFLTTQNEYIGYGTLAVEGGRLNDDDQIDLVAVTLQGKVRIQLNTTPPGQHPQTYANYDLWIGTGHSSVLLRDFSGDGLLDIALADQDANRIRIGRNRGDGTDYEWTSVPTCNHPQRIASGDLNGDGVEDLVFPCQYSAELSVQLGAGDCFFGQPATYPVGQWPIDVALRDLDVDGDLDVVVSNELSESISILRNRDPRAEPDQMFEVLPVVPLTAPFGILVEDLDGDFFPDIAVATRDSAQVAVYRMLANCQLAPPRFFPTGGAPTEKLRGLAALDFDGDGDLDVAVTNSDANTLVLMENDGAGTLFRHVVRSTGTRPILPLAADIDRNGTVDLVVPARESGEIKTFYNAPGLSGIDDSRLTPAVALTIHPNPFRDTVHLTLRGEVGPRVEILDAAGRLVRGFSTAGHSAQEQRFVWDGRDDAGRLVAPGVYFVRTGTPVEGRAVLIRLR